EQCQAIDPSILIGLTALIGRIGDDVKSLIGLAAPCRNGTGGNKNPNAPGRAALPRSPDLFARKRLEGLQPAQGNAWSPDQKDHGRPLASSGRRFCRSNLLCRPCNSQPTTLQPAICNRAKGMWRHRTVAFRGLACAIVVTPVFTKIL